MLPSRFRNIFLFSSSAPLFFPNKITTTVSNSPKGRMSLLSWILSLYCFIQILFLKKCLKVYDHSIMYIIVTFFDFFKRKRLTIERFPKTDLLLRPRFFRKEGYYLKISMKGTYSNLGNWFLKRASLLILIVFILDSN